MDHFGISPLLQSYNVSTLSNRRSPAAVSSSFHKLESSSIQLDKLECNNQSKEKQLNVHHKIRKENLSKRHQHVSKQLYMCENSSANAVSDSVAMTKLNVPLNQIIKKDKNTTSCNRKEAIDLNKPTVNAVSGYAESKRKLLVKIPNISE